MVATKVRNVEARINLVIFVLLVVCFGGLFVRLIYLQIVKHEHYKKQVEKQYMTVTHLKPVRGHIYDCKMNVLAKSACVWNVIVSPHDTPQERKKVVAADLADILDEDKEKLNKLLAKESNYEIIKRGIEKSIADKVRNYKKENKIWSIYLEPSSKRYYLRQNFLANVLGFVGLDEQGLEGLEHFYDDELKGLSGKMIASTNAWGINMPDSTQLVHCAQNGNSLVLTIDANIQGILEKHLQQAILDYSVKNRAAGIIMDVNTGEILAMATKPDFDPNKPFEVFDSQKREEISKIKDLQERQKERQAALVAQWRNKAVMDPYEPGSIFKMVTAASALEEGTSSLSSSYHCSGSIKVDDRQIRCWRHEGHGTLGFDRALIHSCNSAFGKIGLDLGTENFVKYFEAFGFLELTGIDLPGEARSIFHSNESFKKHALAVSSMGQTFKTTMIQLLTGVSAVVNGGKLVRPYIVKQIIDDQKNVIKFNEPAVKRHVISKEVSNAVSLICERVVSEAGGRQAYRKGYHTGGKTGTAEQIDKKVDGEVKSFTLSFVAFTPADKPQFAILVILDDPRGSEIWGSVMAVPVVGRILDDLYRYMNVESALTDGMGTELSAVSIPNLVTKDISKAKDELYNCDLKSRVLGEGDVVKKQLPAPGMFVPRESVVTLYTDSVKELLLVSVPDVVGKTLSEAIRVLNKKGLNYLLKEFQESPSSDGDVVITAQTPHAEEEIKSGSVVELECMYKADANVH
ncbi:MAG: PASTA domain-containing protein [Oscillospiraceae bacterium]|nr:PASTA domain-containing protein [Oscillospiraceae bacterium]